MKTEIVIARYNENIDWIKKLDKDIKISIYNKGLKNITYPFIQLPNIGRESHTYLYHIINNYNSLEDLTIFCQGDSIFHSPDFLKLIKLRKYFEPVQPLSAYYWPIKDKSRFPTPPNEILDMTKDNWIKGNRINVEYLDNNFASHYPKYYYDESFSVFCNRVKKIYNVDNLLEFYIKRFHLTNVDTFHLIPFCFAGLFSVKKNVILEKSIHYYKNIMNILINDNHYLYKNKYLDQGLFLEKLWLVIFNYKKHNSHYLNLKTKDYKLYDYNFNIIDNKINFDIILYNFDLYFYLYFDQNNNTDKYKLKISRFDIYLFKVNNKKTIFSIDNVMTNKKIQNIFNGIKKNILIELYNQVLRVYIDKKILFEFNIQKNILKKIILNGISKDNLLNIYV